MHYLRIRPTQLAASFVKADRVAHMISMLIDLDPEAASLTGPDPRRIIIWAIRIARIPSVAAVISGWPASAVILTCSNRVRADWYWKAKPLSGVTLKKFLSHLIRKPSWNGMQRKLRGRRGD